jgi:hypothetical protein
MTTLEAWEKERERRTRGSNGGGAMSNDDVVQIPVVATVDPCAKLRAECNRLENEKSGAEFRCRELLGERRKLREALKLFVKLEDVQRYYPIEVALALATLGETEGKE